MLNFPPAVEIENVSGGVARDVIRGNDLPNRFSGSGGNDELVGRGGDDALSGGQGADAFDGGEGIDELNGGIGNDAYLFQNGWGEDRITDDAISGGTDRLFFGDLITPVNVDLTASDGVEVSSGVGPTVNTVDWPPASEIENATGGTDNDDLRGNQSDNTLNGQGGDDTISGGGGHDTISGGDGDDTIDVADGDLLIGDTVNCGPGTDTVDADAIDAVDPSCETIS
jgi:Ca2+-binding RTX toxin-like protein